MWPLIVAAQILVVDLPHPLELGRGAAEITLIEAQQTDLRRQVNTIAKDSEQNLVLRLASVEADETPNVSWEVYVASSDTEDCDNVPALAGILSLYGTQPSTEYVFPLGPAIVASQPIGLKIIFKPISGLEVADERAQPAVQNSVRVGAISLETEKRSTQ